MEKGTLHPYKLEAPPSQSQAQAPSDGHRAPAPALFFSSSSSSHESDEGEEEFEFPFVSRDSPAGTAAPADELFADGRIRPFYYPVFGRGVFSEPARPAQHHPAAAAPRVRGRLGRLFLEESRARNASVSSSTSTASSSSSEVDGAPPESYCLWTPGASRPPRKSDSTGSAARWRRISELVVGRSHSDGKEKLMFFPAPQPKAKAKAKPSPGTSGVRKAAAPAEVVVDAAHGGKPTPRRTFLPYREELVGFFANVNGVGRSQHHPF